MKIIHENFKENKALFVDLLVEISGNKRVCVWGYIANITETHKLNCFIDDLTTDDQICVKYSELPLEVQNYIEEKIENEINNF